MNAIFVDTQLEGAFFSGADLSNSSLRDAIFNSADLTDANLRDGDLSNAHFVINKAITIKNDLKMGALSTLEISFEEDDWGSTITLDLLAVTLLSVPEPATVLLLGLVALSVRRRSCGL